MQIQPISNNYQPQRTQKQNNPSFKALIKPVDEHVFGNVLRDLDTIGHTKAQKPFIERAKDRLIEVMGYLIDHNNNSRNHLRVDASNTIPVKKVILFNTYEGALIDSTNPQVLHTLPVKIEEYDGSPTIYMTMKNGFEYGIPLYPHDNASEEGVRRIATRIQKDAIERFHRKPETGQSYNKLLLEGGTIKNQEL